MKNYLSKRETQEKLLELLVQFDRVCQCNGIRYSLFAGTLLGAIRHQGFIPWDDDVDVIVPKPDYDRLIRHPEWFSGHLKLVCPGDQSYPLPICKLFDLNWRAQEPALVGIIDEYLWIDIFCADAIPDDPDEATQLFSRQERLLTRGGRSLFNGDETATSTAKKIAKKIVLPFYRAAYPFDKQFTSVLAEASRNSYGTTKLVGNITWGPIGKFKIPTTDFESLQPVLFEGRIMQAIPSWDYMLAEAYGDYMQLPSENERSTHGIKVWHA